MNKSEIISKFKAYTPAALTCVGIVVGSAMANQISIARLRALRDAQRLSKTALVAYKHERNNWRKLHCKPMKRRKQLEKVKSFY